MPEFTVFDLTLPFEATVAVLLGAAVVVVATEDMIARWLPTRITRRDPDRTTAMERGLLYLLLPLLVALLVLKQTPERIGLAIGDWQAGTAAVAVVWALTVGFAIWHVRQARPASRSAPIVEVIVVAGLKVLPLEFLFRGFLLGILFDRVGGLAVALQTVPHVLGYLNEHSTKRLGALAALFGLSLGLGWLAWRTGSILYVTLIHWPLLALFTRYPMDSRR